MEQACASNRQSFIHFNVTKLDVALAGMKNLNMGENQSLKPVTCSSREIGFVKSNIYIRVYVMHFNLTSVSFNL